MTTIPQRLARCAADRPDAAAFEQLRDGRRLTFAEWEARSNAVARGLRAWGVGPGERVVIHGDAGDWIDVAVAYVATQKLRAVPLPIAASAGRDHLAWAIGEAGAAVAVGRDAQALGDLRSAPADALADGRERAPLELEARPDDVAEILYTSGTTGRAKGVVATHANMLAAHARPPRPTARPRRVLHSLQPATMAGQGLLVLPLHPEPHAVLALPPVDAASTLAAIAEHRPTDLVLVPAIASALTRVADPPDGLDVVELVRSTSAPISPATLERLGRLFRRARVVNLYATTESWPARTQLRYDAARTGSVGRPVADGAVRVVGADGRPLAAGQHGDVQLRAADAPRRSYFRDPDATRAVFLDDGWVRTGDVGYLDADGYLHLVDRHADLVNVGGRNVSALDLEARIEAQDGVLAAAVIGVAHPTLGETVVAAVEAEPAASVAAIEAVLDAQLGARTGARRVHVVERLPRNVVGKVLKRELREQLADGLAAETSAPPATAAEARMAQIWRAALELEEVGREDNFFDLGGTSLTVLDVTAEVRAAFGVELDARDLMQAATLADYAALVEVAPVGGADRAPTGPVRVPRSFEQS